MNREYPLHPLKSVLEVEGFCIIRSQEKPSGYCFPGETHDFTELIYADRGHFYLLLDGQGYRVEEGELFCFGVNQHHLLWSDLGTLIRFITLSFRMRLDDESALLHRRFVTDGPLRALLGRILSEHALYVETQGPLEGQRLKLSLEELMLRLLAMKPGGRREESSPAVVSSGRRMMLNRLTDFIGEHLSERLPLSRIAGVIPLSESALIQLFRRELSCSPGEYVLQARLGRAKALIREGGLSMTEIASRCGFSSPHYFSRLFRERTGVSPTQYAGLTREKRL